MDDNLIGTRSEHIARAKDLFCAMAQANLQKKYVIQAALRKQFRISLVITHE